MARTMMNSVDLYSNELEKALLEFSEDKLNRNIANRIASQYANKMDFEDSILMHIGINSIAKDLISKIKPEYFKSS